MPANMQDLTGPSIKSLEIVRNKNNAAEMVLRRKLEAYDREKTFSIMSMDHERLDTKDFLREIRAVSSDDLPEARLWLGDGFRPPSNRSRRTVSTAPPGGRREKQEAEAEDVHSDDETKKKRGHSYLDRIREASKIQLEIYSKRNEYSSLQRPIVRPVWPGMEDRFDEHGNPISRDKAVSFEDGTKGAGGGGRGAGGSRGGSASRSSSRADKDRGQSAGLEGNPPLGSADDPDFMKDLLVKNARRRYKKRGEQKAPLEERLSQFFSKIEDVKTEDEQFSRGELTTETRRKWTLMTKGAKAAIEIRGDSEGEEEEDNPLNTV